MWSRQGGTAYRAFVVPKSCYLYRPDVIEYPNISESFQLSKGDVHWHDSYIIEEGDPDIGTLSEGGRRNGKDWRSLKARHGSLSPSGA